MEQRVVDGPGAARQLPQDGLATYGKDVPAWKASDLDEMNQPLDFIGLNLYKAETYRRGADGKPEIEGLHRPAQ